MIIPESSQIRAIDAYTIAHEPISSIDLMQRAAVAVADWLLQHVEYGASFKVLAGSGNNGGDALYVAHLLALAGFDVECFLFNYAQKLSDDCSFHKEIAANDKRMKFREIIAPEFFPAISPSDWVVDGLFGTGLNRPLEEPFVSLIRHVNASGATVVSIDVPSGLFGENNDNNHAENCIHASHTLTFQFPKIAFLLAENSAVVGAWEVLPIGLHPEAIAGCATDFSLASKPEVTRLLKPRAKFAHKGTYGHALLAGGSKGKMGAMILSSRAALRSGVGLLTVHVPSCGNDILQVSVPEAMTQGDTMQESVSSVSVGAKINAIGIGCGMGSSPEAAGALHRLLQSDSKPMVIDADGLNLLSQYPEWLELLPENTLLTPHPVEFDRLAGASQSGYERLEKARAFARKYRVIVVLKGAYTAVINRDGKVSFNSTGNPGMATAGSGDTLTGILVALQAQGYAPYDAAVLGVYVHGLAGDIASCDMALESITASDIIARLGLAFSDLRK